MLESDYQLQVAEWEGYGVCGTSRSGDGNRPNQILTQWTYEELFDQKSLSVAENEGMFDRRDDLVELISSAPHILI